MAGSQRQAQEAEERHHVCRPGHASRWTCQGNLPGLGGSSIHRIPATPITRPLDQIPGPWPRVWRGKWQPNPVFVPRKSHGHRSLVGYSPWDGKELDTTEWLTHSNTFRVPPSPKGWPCGLLRPQILLLAWQPLHQHSHVPESTRGNAKPPTWALSFLFPFPSGVTSQWLKEGAVPYLSFVSLKKKKKKKGTQDSLTVICPTSFSSPSPWPSSRNAELSV